MAEEKSFQGGMVMKKAYSALIVLLLVLTGCSTNPVTGKSEISLISTQQEIAIGEKNYAPSQQAQGGEYYVDRNLQTYVDSVGNKLAAVSDRQLPYEFVVLNNSVPNAWAMPGGKIAVNRGLLVHLEDEAQLAAVLGHEIVHAAARHSAKQMTRGTLIGVGGQILGIVAGQKGYGQIASPLIQMGSAAWMSRYGRSAELESDNYGMEYMAKAGYDPQGAVELQRTFVKLSEGRKSDFFANLFASHPPSEDRVAANIEKAKTLGPGNNFRANYQKAIAQLIKDQPAYEAQDEAIKALNNKDPVAALKQIDSAIKIQPQEGYFWELRGHALAMQDKKRKAERAFSTAIERNDSFFSHYLARGMLRYDRGNKIGAKTDLERSHGLLPTQQSSFALGEIAQESGQQSKALEYYQAAAGSGGDLGKTAQTRVIDIELPTAPAKYIPSQLFVSKKGYLQIALKNNTHLTVTNIRIEITEVLEGNRAGRQAILSGPRSLGAGEQASVPTRIAINESSPRYQVRVVSAKPIR